MKDSELIHLLEDMTDNIGKIDPIFFLCSYIEYDYRKSPDVVSAIQKLFKAYTKKERKLINE